MGSPKERGAGIGAGPGREELRGQETVALNGVASVPEACDQPRTK
jgi:hypothetical protein